MSGLSLNCNTIWWKVHFPRKGNYFKHLIFCRNACRFEPLALFTLKHYWGVFYIDTWNLRIWFFILKLWPFRFQKFRLILRKVCFSGLRLSMARMDGGMELCKKVYSKREVIWYFSKSFECFVLIVICNFFPIIHLLQCVIVGGSKFLFWTNFTTHFTFLGTTFDLKKTPFPSFKDLDKFHQPTAINRPTVIRHERGW